VGPFRVLLLLSIVRLQVIKLLSELRNVLRNVLPDSNVHQTY